MSRGLERLGRRVFNHLLGHGIEGQLLSTMKARVESYEEFAEGLTLGWRANFHNVDSVMEKMLIREVNAIRRLAFYPRGHMCPRPAQLSYWLRMTYRTR